MVILTNTQEISVVIRKINGNLNGKMLKITTILKMVGNLYPQRGIKNVDIGYNSVIFQSLY